MKYIIRSVVFNIFSLWLSHELLPMLVIDGSWTTYGVAGLVLTVLMLIVVPFLKILFIPINFLTFGAASLLINSVVLLLLTFFVTQVEVIEMTTSGTGFGGFVIPPIHFPYLLSLVVVSLVVTGITNILHWASQD
jgi:uncharacterized membrane protein YvlD (DUF360 family)